MPSQVVYQTNADWYESREALVNNSLVKADTTDKGLIKFWFRDNPTLFMLASTGKLQVKWNNIDEKRVLFRLIKNLLVAAPNETLLIKPLKQQVWVNYPVPESFKLFWCDQSTEFVLRKPSELKEEVKLSKFVINLYNVEKAVEQLRREFRFFREPTQNEVALKSGCKDLGDSEDRIGS